MLFGPKRAQPFSQFRLAIMYTIYAAAVAPAGQTLPRQPSETTERKHSFVKIQKYKQIQKYRLEKAAKQRRVRYTVEESSSPRAPCLGRHHAADGRSFIYLLIQKEAFHRASGSFQRSIINLIGCTTGNYSAHTRNTIAKDKHKYLHTYTHTNIHSKRQTYRHRSNFRSFLR